MTEGNISSIGAGATEAAPQLATRNTIAIGGGKGGVGKTWFSVTLCQALAKLGRQILLFDADFGLANVDVQLGLLPEKDLGTVLKGQTTMAGAITKYEEGGFSIIAGSSGTGALGVMSVQRMNELRAQLYDVGRKYDNVVLDLGAGIDRIPRLFAPGSRTCLVIVTDEPSSRIDAFTFMKVILALNPSADLRVVVNMAPSLIEGEKIYDSFRKSCQTFLHYSPPLAGIIRRDVKVREAIRAQMSVLQRSPSSDAALDVEALALRLNDSL